MSLRKAGRFSREWVTVLSLARPEAGKRTVRRSGPGPGSGLPTCNRPCAARTASISITCCGDPCWRTQRANSSETRTENSRFIENLGATWEQNPPFFAQRRFPKALKSKTGHSLEFSWDIDTVEVWGSSPHGPTIAFNNLEIPLFFRLAPSCSNKTLRNCQ
jgi:hypothetical protein